jgi:hypothetical protein
LPADWAVTAPGVVFANGSNEVACSCAYGRHCCRLRIAQRFGVLDRQTNDFIV